jgi:HEPN domain-containing protein
MIEERDPTDPRIWLVRARSNLRLAEVGHRQGVLLEDLCFEAQQAAEKALKALCVRDGLDFPRTHSLVVLIDILESAGLSLPYTFEKC